MERNRVGKLLRLASMMLAGVPLLGGCQATSGFGSMFARKSSSDVQLANKQNAFVPVQQANAPPGSRLKVASGMELEWAVKSPSATPEMVRAGKGRVARDGTLALGPYGSCKVGGLSLDQASLAVEKHLSAYIRQPSVTLSTQLADGPRSADVAWRPSQGPTATTQPVAQGTNPKAGIGKFDPIRTVTYQPPAKESLTHGPFLKQDGALASRQVGVYQPPPTQHPLAHNPQLILPYPGAPTEMNMVSLPPYVIGPPDVLQIESLKGLVTQPIRGPHLIRPDGTIGLGVYGSVQVAGMTLDQAKDAIARTILSRLDEKKVPYKDVMDNLSVDLLALNSKVYYIITDGAGFGDQVYSFPITGSENVLDAMSKINGLPAVGSKKHIWVARRNGHIMGPDCRMPVDWINITQNGSGLTNYQIFPGDRIFVKADSWRTFDSVLGKILAPFERLTGGVLLGGQAASTIRNINRGGGNNNSSNNTGN